MKNIIYISIVTIIFAVSFVSCEMDDANPKKVLYCDSIVNELPFNIALNVNQAKYYVNSGQKCEFFNLETTDEGTVLLNADFAYKGGTGIRKDSMIVVKNYLLSPINKIIEVGNIVYSINYYTFTEDVFRDIIAKMHSIGYEPQVFDLDFFDHTEFMLYVYTYKNTSSYDIKLDAPFSTILRQQEAADINIEKGQKVKTTILNCVIYFGDIKNGTAKSLKVSDFKWNVSEETSSKVAYTTTNYQFFNFTDTLLDKIISFMAAKNVFPEECDFPIDEE